MYAKVHVALGVCFSIVLINLSLNMPSHTWLLSQLLWLFVTIVWLFVYRGTSCEADERCVCQ